MVHENLNDVRKTGESVALFAVGSAVSFPPLQHFQAVCFSLGELES
jgi:hypothetical protein